MRVQGRYKKNDLRAAGLEGILNDNLFSELECAYQEELNCIKHIASRKVKYFKSISYSIIENNNQIDVNLRVGDIINVLEDISTDTINDGENEATTIVSYARIQAIFLHTKDQLEIPFLILDWFISLNTNDSKLDCSRYRLQRSADHTWRQIYVVKWVDHQPNVHFVHQCRKSGCDNGRHDENNVYYVHSNAINHSLAFSLLSIFTKTSSSNCGIIKFSVVRYDGSSLKFSIIAVFRKVYFDEKNFNITTKEWKYEIGTCFVCQKCLYCGVNLAEGSVCNCEKTLKPTNSSKTKKLQVGHVRNGVYKHNESHSILVSASNLSNSQLLRDQNTYNKNNLISIDEKENQTVKTPIKPLNPSKLNNVLNSNSDIPFRFKLVIKTPDLTKPAKAIILEKIPAYFEFDDLVLQKVCKTVGLVVRTKYELSYKAEKGTGAGTILEEEEDFEEFIREYHRLTISDKALLITATVKQKEKAKRKKKSLEISDGNESVSEDDELELTAK
ncbi:unnamed protein product [Rhizophagus irregularis]|nr:unnamed protein product [Rhizophagus irregularis]